MYAIRNRHKMEKIQRANYYHNLHNKIEKKEMEGDDDHNKEEREENGENDEQKDEARKDQDDQDQSDSQNVIPQNNHMQGSVPGINNDNVPLLNQNEEMMQAAPNFNGIFFYISLMKIE